MRQTIGLLALVLLIGAGLPPSLEGDWVLVEQRYGQGARNIYDNEQPVRLSIRPGAGEPVVTITAEGGPATDWPAWIGSGAPVDVELESRSVELAHGRISARFRLVSPDDPEFVFRVAEQYQLTPDGKALEGTITVSFERDGEPRGSFILTSRFERVR